MNSEKNQMKIKKIDINLINPAGYNPRLDLQPGDKEYEKIKISIEKFGYVDPIIINKDFTCVGGHQRLKVLKELGYVEIECVILDLSKEDEKALNLALNKISGGFESAKLKDLLLDLDNGEFEMKYTGFDEEELESLMTEFHPPEEKEKEAKTKDPLICPECGHEFE